MALGFTYRRWRWCVTSGAVRERSMTASAWCDSPPSRPAPRRHPALPLPDDGVYAWEVSRHVRLPSLPGPSLGQATWSGHLVRPFGQAIWSGHLVRPFGQATWSGHLVRPHEIVASFHREWVTGHMVRPRSTPSTDVGLACRDGSLPTKILAGIWWFGELSQAARPLSWAGRAGGDPDSPAGKGFTAECPP